MRNNLFYEAVLEGRYQLPITTQTLLDDDGSESYLATYTDVNGHAIEVTDTNQAEAHRRCTAEVLERVRQGMIHPGQNG